MTAPPLSVVVGLAFADSDGFAFDRAATLAQRVPGSELHVVHVFDSEPSSSDARQLVEHLRLYVNEKAAQRGGLKSMTVGIHLRSGKPVQELAQLASDVAADVIVLGAHRGPDVKAWIHGTTVDRLMRDGPCPVIVAGPPPAARDPQVPAIEPPCPDCVSARAASGGTEWWCARHAHHAKRPHTFSYRRELPFATHDSEVIPTGIKMS